MSQIGKFSSLNAAMESLSGDVGGTVFPSAGNINILGDGTIINVIGTPLTHTLTITPSEAVPGNFPTDAGDATPVHNEVSVLGGTNIGTVGVTGNPAIPTPSTITINLSDNVSIAGTFDAVGDITSSAGDIEATLGNFLAPAGQLSVGLTVNAVGNITSSTGDIVATLGAGSFATSVTAGNDLHVLAGGADIVGTVEFSDLTAGTMRTDAAGVISALADGTDGMVLISSTAGTPIWATLTAGANIGIVEAANSITISATGVVTSVAGGTNINLTGTAAAPVVNLDDAITLTTVNAVTFETSVAAAYLSLSGTSLIADGTDANIDINITAKGTGQVIIDDLQLTADLAVQYGGTGVSTLTQYGVLVGNAATDIQVLAVGATNQVLLGNTGANPSWGAVDLTTDITGTLPVGNGGTGAATFTDHGILIGSAAGAITALAEATNGQLPIGSTGADPTLATITEGTNIDITNAAGSITVETTKTELDVQTGTTYTLVLGDRGKTVTLNNAAAITLTVPPNASVAFATGTVISLAQLGAGQVTVAAGAAVTIRSEGSKLKLSAQYTMAALTKIASDEWILAGSLSA